LFSEWVASRPLYYPRGVIRSCSSPSISCRFAAFDRPRSPAPLRRETHETFFGDQILAPSFLNRFNHFRVSRPVSSVLACYTRIRRRQCLIPSLPSSPSLSPIPAPSRSRIQLKLRRLRTETSRETHLAKKPLPLRLPTSTSLRNPLKKSVFQRHDSQ